MHGKINNVKLRISMLICTLVNNEQAFICASMTHSNTCIIITTSTLQCTLLHNVSKWIQMKKYFQGIMQIMYIKMVSFIMNS